MLILSILNGSTIEPSFVRSGKSNRYQTLLRKSVTKPPYSFHALQKRYKNRVTQRALQNGVGLCMVSLHSSQQRKKGGA